jgi:hypothetical protein
MPIKNNAMPDIITQIYPWKYITIESWKSGEVPLWNPYSFSGTTHAGNYQSAVFTPINLLFFLLPFIDAWSLSVLLQPLCAGLFMFWFLKKLGRSAQASLLGSISFMFCGFMTTWMGYQTLGWAITFLPLVLGAAHSFATTKKWWSGPLISIGVCVSLLSGHYQISFYMLFAVVIFVFCSNQKWKDKVKILLYISAGIAMAAPQILLALHALRESGREESFTVGSIPWKYIVTLFAPDFFGNPVTRNDWFGQYAEWASYSGVAPLFLAVYSIFGKRERIKNIFFLLSVTSVCFAFATPLNSLLYGLKIPILSTSVATRMIVLLSFSIATLSSFGIDELFDDWKKKTTKSIKKVLVLGTFLLLILGIILFISRVLPIDYLSIAKRNSIIPITLLIVTMAITFVGFKVSKFRYLCIFLLIVMTAGDMIRYSSKWMPFESREYVYPEIPMVSLLKNIIGNNRVYGSFGGELSTHVGLQSIEGYDALYQRRYGEFISSGADGKVHSVERSVVHIDRQGKFTQRIFSLLGVRYLLYRKSDGRNVWVFPHWNYPQYTSRFEDQQYEVLENKDVLPRVYLASSYKVAQSDAEILSLVHSPETDLSTTVVLEVKPSVEPQVGDGAVEILRTTPNSLIIQATTTAPKLLFVSDVYDTGWQVSVNGKPENIFRANYAFRAVLIPKGESTVEFIYRPREFIVGIWLAAIAAFVLLASSMRKLYYDRRHL